MAACTYPPHPFGRRGDGKRLMCCDRILETVGLSDKSSATTLQWGAIPSENRESVCILGIGTSDDPAIGET